MFVVSSKEGAPVGGPSLQEAHSDSTEGEEAFQRSPSFFQYTKTKIIHTAEVHSGVGDVGSKKDVWGSGDGGQEQPSRRRGVDKEGKTRKRVRRRGTFTLRKTGASGRRDSATEVVSSGGSSPANSPGSSGRVLLIPLTGFVIHTFTYSRDHNLLRESHLLPSGGSSPANSPGSSGRVLLIPLTGESRRRKQPSGYATETLSEEESPSDEDEVRPVVVPVAAPRQRPISSTGSTSTVSEIHTTQPGNLPLSPGRGPPVPLPRRCSATKEVARMETDPSEDPEMPPSSQSCYTTSSHDYTDTPIQPPLLPREKKRRKRKKHKESASEEGPAEEEMKKCDEVEVSGLTACPESKSESVLEATSKDEEEVGCIVIHTCEPLRVNSFKTQPYVRVCVMDTQSGQLKLNTSQEPLKPLQTHPYDYLFQRSAVPVWEEELILLQPLSDLTTPTTILIFEILDRGDKNKLIAWGFLKPLGANGVSNAKKRLRLQLYKPGKKVSSKGSQLPPSPGYLWWSKGGYSPYKSTLFVTLNGIPSRMILPIQDSQDSPEDKKEEDLGSRKQSLRRQSVMEEEELRGVKWGRLPSLSCKLPNKLLASLDAGPDGGLALAYSHSGLLLASANKINISIFTFRGRVYLLLLGHQGLVYSVKWSSDDKYLLSVSADSTACIWNIAKKITTPIQVLSHPSYVYSCGWLDESTLCTGCFDGDIRVWTVNSDSLVSQLSKHAGPVNSIDTTDNLFISGDSFGVIHVWERGSDGRWGYSRELAVRELKGKVIDKLTLHPGGQRVLVHTRDSFLRMVHIATGAVIQWFQGGVWSRLRGDSCLCGCGSSVLALSEDATLTAWHSNTGARLAVYSGIIPPSAAGGLAFHPRDSMLAVVALLPGQAAHLTLLVFDKQSCGKEVGLVLVAGGNLNSSQLSLQSGSSSDIYRSSQNTPRKKEGILRALFGKRKKTHNGLSENGGSLSESGGFSNLSPRMSGNPRFLDDNENEMERKEDRLNEIIKRMDKILKSISHSSQSEKT